MAALRGAHFFMRNRVGRPQHVRVAFHDASGAIAALLLAARAALFGIAAGAHHRGAGLQFVKKSERLLTLKTASEDDGSDPERFDGTQPPFTKMASSFP
jgi:hypothetical protein